MAAAGVEAGTSGEAGITEAMLRAGVRSREAELAFKVTMDAAVGMLARLEADKHESAGDEIADMIEDTLGIEACRAGRMVSMRS